MTRTCPTLLGPVYLCLFGVLGLGCVQVEDVPLVDASVNQRQDGGLHVDGGRVGQDAGATEEDAGTPDTGTVDPRAAWPALVYERSRPILEFQSCGSSLLWSVAGTIDGLGNRRADAEVWAWDAGGSPRLLVSDLAPFSGFPPSRLVGCFDGRAYWNEVDGASHALHSRVIVGDSSAQRERDGYWQLGDAGLLMRRVGASTIEVVNLMDSAVTSVELDGLLYNLAAFWVTPSHVYYMDGDTQIARVAYPLAATAEDVGSAAEWRFGSVAGRVIVQSSYDGALGEVLPSGQGIRLASVSAACAPNGGVTPRAMRRGAWILWSFAGGVGGCAEVGRSAVDHEGNVRVQRLEEISTWATEMAALEGLAGHELVVAQFGERIAMANLPQGTIRLADEPPFSCIDATLPCPEGADCATTVCADLPD